MHETSPSTGIDTINAVPTMSGILMKSMELAPELAARSIMAHWREKFVVILNAALRTQAYAERFEETYKQYRQEADAERKHAIITPAPDMQPMHDTVFRESEMQRSKALSLALTNRQVYIVNEVIALLNDDFCLGHSYIASRRGEEGALQYVRDGALDTIIGIGKTLRWDKGEERQRAIVGDNQVTIQGNRTDQRAVVLKFSCALQSIFKQVPRVRHYQEFLTWQEQIQQSERVIAAAAELGLTPDNAHSVVMKEHSMDYLQKLATYSLFFGLAELAYFTATFSHAHDREPAGALSLSPDLLPFFERYLKMSQKKATAFMRRACDERFPDHPDAWTLVEYGMETFRNLYAQEKRHRSPEWIARDLFPHRDVQRAQKASTLSILSFESHRPGRDDAWNMRKKEALVPRATELLALSEAELIATCRAYPSGFEWHPLLLQASAQDTANVVRRLLTTKDPYTQMVGVQLLLLALSLEPEIRKFEKSMELFYTVGLFQNPLLRRNPQSPLLHILRSLPGTDEDPTITEPLSILLNTSIPIASRPIREVVQLLSDQLPHPPVYQVERWHPSFHSSATSYEYGTDLAYTRDAHIFQSVDHLLRQGLCTTDTQWIRCIDSMMEAGGAKKLQRVLESLPPERVPRILAGIMGDLLGDDMAVQLKEDPGEIGAWSESQLTYVDVPPRLLMHPGTGHLAVSRSWMRTHNFMMQLTDEQKCATEAVIEEFADATVMELYPHIDDREHIFRPFTGSTPWTKDDVEVLVRVCGTYYHHTLHPVLVEKAMAQSTDAHAQLIDILLSAGKIRQLLYALKHFPGDLRDRIRQSRIPFDTIDHVHPSILEIIQEENIPLPERFFTLPTMDAVIAFLLLFQRIAEQEASTLTTSDLFVKSWSRAKSPLPPPFAHLNAILASHRDLRDALARTLRQQGDILLTDIHIEWPVDEEEAKASDVSFEL